MTELERNVLELGVGLGGEVSEDVGVLVGVAQQLALALRQLPAVGQQALDGDGAALEAAAVDEGAGAAAAEHLARRVRDLADRDEVLASEDGRRDGRVQAAAGAHS